MSADAQFIRPKIERPVANDPIPKDDYISPYTSSPRIYRGVHRRDLRLRGQTPAESAAMDRSLHDIFEQLGDNNHTSNFELGASSNISKDDSGLRSWSRSVRRGYDREENDDMVEALDELKEEVSAISTDFELLDWARRRVFDTLPKPTSNTHTTSDSMGSVNDDGSGSNGDAETFPSTYPRILAHLMKISRQNFSNPHLSLSLFHLAQTHSPESYLSGCLSSAYTELIRTRWECFRDLEGVHRAIKEMEVNAVSWDRTTQATIGKIVEQVGRDVLQSGAGKWGEEVYGILEQLEQRVQKSLRQTEYYDDKARRERDRRIFA